MKISSYQDLEVWKRSMDLAEKIYFLTKSFPTEELYGMTTQIRRAASSIPANIAEGWGRQGNKEFQQFLRIAQGSLRELETHLILSNRINLCSDIAIAEPLEQINILSKQLRALINSLKRTGNQ